MDGGVDAVCRTFGMTAAAAGAAVGYKISKRHFDTPFVSIVTLLIYILAAAVVNGVYIRIMPPAACVSGCRGQFFMC
jgi:hypothetical protein